MRAISSYLLAICLCALAAPAIALPTAPLEVLNAYIEGNGHCSPDLIAWNRKYIARAITGEVSRIFYYRVVALQEWGDCGQPFVKKVFGELQKIWIIHSQGKVSDAEAESKEAELIDLLFSALASGNKGGDLVQRYEQRTTWRLMRLEPEHQFFNCTFFGERPKCAD